MAAAGMRSTPAPKVSLGTKWLVECETSTVMVWAAGERGENRDEGKNGGRNFHAKASISCKKGLALKRFNYTDYAPLGRTAFGVFGSDETGRL